MDQNDRSEETPFDRACRELSEAFDAAAKEIVVAFKPLIDAIDATRDRSAAGDRIARRTRRQHHAPGTYQRRRPNG